MKTNALRRFRGVLSMLAALGAGTVFGGVGASYIGDAQANDPGAIGPFAAIFMSNGHSILPGVTLNGGTGISISGTVASLALV